MHASVALIQYPYPGSMVVRSLNPGLYGSWNFQLLSMNAHMDKYLSAIEATASPTACELQELYPTRFQPLASSIELDGAEPDTVRVQSHIQNTKTAMFYEVAHGDSTGFSSDCSPTGYITANEIGSWIADYRKMPFTFFGSCNGMCDTESGTISYEFRKGSLSDTATVGYCGMSQDYCSDCWTYSVDWQDALFSYMNEGYSVREAYDKAMADYPMCAPIEGSCMRFAGDEDFAVVPVVTRDLDSDNDGVPDQEEQGSEGSDPAFDGNDDGISDFLQDNAVSFLTRDKQNYLTIACPITASMSNVAAVDIPSPADAPSGIKFTYGFIDFRVSGLDPGGGTTVTLYLPDGANSETYYKYGPTPDDPSEHWYEFLYDGETGATIDENVVTLYFVDGSRGDDDLNSTNGTIIDQGGMGFDSTSANSSGGGGGCFIAAAAYSVGYSGDPERPVPSQELPPNPPQMIGTLVDFITLMCNILGQSELIGIYTYTP